MSKEGDRCFVCGRGDGLHDHHAVPRAYGGGTPLPNYPDGFTLPVCGGDHTLVHAIADHYWSTGELPYEMLPEDAEQARRVRALVTTIYVARFKAEGVPKPVKFSTTFSAARSQRLKELGIILGCSQETAVHTAIDRLHQSLTMKSSKAVGAR